MNGFERLLHISVLTLGEIRKGVVNLPAGKRRTNLEIWVDIELRERFAGRILLVDAAVADRWSILAGEAKRKGTPIGTVDGILAATALHHNLTVVICNVSDFRRMPAPVVNPWDPA